MCHTSMSQQPPSRRHSNATAEKTRFPMPGTEVSGLHMSQHQFRADNWMYRHTCTLQQSFDPTGFVARTATSATHDKHPQQHNHLLNTSFVASITHGNILQHTAAHCNTLQPHIRSTSNHTATHCNTLQHTATHCNTM